MNPGYDVEGGLAAEGRGASRNCLHVCIVPRREKGTQCNRSTKWGNLAVKPAPNLTGKRSYSVTAKVQLGGQVHILSPR